MHPASLHYGWIAKRFLLSAVVLSLVFHGPSEAARRFEDLLPELQKAAQENPREVWKVYLEHLGFFEKEGTPTPERLRYRILAFPWISGEIALDELQRDLSALHLEAKEEGFESDWLWSSFLLETKRGDALLMAASLSAFLGSTQAAYSPEPMVEDLRLPIARVFRELGEPLLALTILKDTPRRYAQPTDTLNTFLARADILQSEGFIEEARGELQKFEWKVDSETDDVLLQRFQNLLVAQALFERSQHLAREYLEGPLDRGLSQISYKCRLQRQLLQRVLHTVERTAFSSRELDSLRAEFRQIGAGPLFFRQLVQWISFFQKIGISGSGLEPWKELLRLEIAQDQRSHTMIEAMQLLSPESVPSPDPQELKEMLGAAAGQLWAKFDSRSLGTPTVNSVPLAWGRNLWILVTVLLFLLVILMAQRIRFYKVLRDRLSHSVREAEKARTEVLHASQLKTEFLASISHEIKTPLNGIIGMSSLLEEILTDKEAMQYLRVLRSSSHNLMVLLNDLLDLAKIEAGRLELESIPFLLKDELAYVEDLVRSYAINKSLQIQFRSELAEDLALIGDPTRISQILLNLLNNAVKFTESGRVELRVLKGPEDSQRQWIICEVADTGIGISAQQQAIIFEPFRQADNSTRRKFGGSGLGLAISRRLCDAMGGKIELESSVGKGSIFRLHLPFPLNPTPKNPLK